MAAPTVDTTARQATTLTMNTQALHLDAAFAETQPPFNQRLVNSMFTLSTLIGFRGAARVLLEDRSIGDFPGWLTTLVAAGGPDDLTVIVTGTVLFAVGLAAVYSLSTDLIVTHTRPEQAGTAGAVTETAAELGGALPAALLRARFRASVTEGVGRATGPG